MPHYRDLFSRRQADLPIYRWPAGNTRRILSMGEFSEELRERALEREVLADRRNRAGDLPHDLDPYVLPRGEVQSLAELATASSDEEGWETAEDILAQIRATGITLAESDDRTMHAIADAIDDPIDQNVDGAVAATLDLVEQLQAYDDPAARAIADRIRPQLEHLGTLGWATVYEPLRVHESGEE